MEWFKVMAERWLPYAVAAVVWAWAVKQPLPLPSKFLTDIIGTSATMASVFMGFMATSMSILITYRGSRMARQLRASGALHTLVTYLREALVWIMLWLLSCFLLYFQQTPPLQTIWAVLATLSLLCFLRVVFLLSRLILS
jgi:hypothetical protein